MLDRLKDHLERTGLIRQGDRILVGYSGGADSTCLLTLLVRLGFDVVAGHLHHGQRQEADQEQRLCEAYTETLGIPFAAGSASIPTISSEYGVGFEEAGRMARYEFFRSAAFRLQCNLVATAHTRSDHVETILLNLGRGSGLAGMTGIPAERDGIVRPLLPFSRAETRSFCEEEGLWFHDDPANDDINLSRARLRHRVVPEFKAINPDFEATVGRFAEIVREEDRFLNGMAAAALEQSEIPLNGPLSFLTSDVELKLNRESISGLPSVLFKRAMRLAAGALGGALDYHQTQLVLEGVTSQPLGSVTAEGGEVVIEWDADAVQIRKLMPTVPFRYGLMVPGETESAEFGWKFEAVQSDPSEAPPVRASMLVDLPCEKVKGDLYFRTFKDGDLMQPLGFDGRRKVADLLSEAGLTIAARKRIPIVCDLVGPIWIPGICLDERVRKDSESTMVYAIRFGPIA